MSNVSGKAYGMNVVTPMRPCLTWINRALFMAARAIPKSLLGLLGLSIIHFARWIIIKRDQWPDLGQGKQSLQNDYAVLQQFQRNVGSVYRHLFRRHSWRARPAVVFEHEISAFDPDQPVQGLHPGKPDRHGLLLQLGPGRRTARCQVGIARPARHPRTGRKAGLVVSGGFSQAVRDRPDWGAERPRLSGLCPDRQRRYGQREPEPRTLRSKSARGGQSARVNPHIVRP